MATIIVSKNTTGTYTNTGYTGVNDTRMNGLAPTTNYSTSSVIATNCWDTSADDCGNTVIKFDVSSVGAGTVTNAEIGFYLNGGNNDFRGVSLYPLLVSFLDTQATFQIRSTGDAWNTPNARGSGTDRASTALLTTSRSATSGAWMTFSGSALNALIEDYLDGTTTNNGFVIELTDYADDLFTYQDYISSEGTDGNRPYLKFDHTATGATHTTTGALVGQGSTIAGTANNFTVHTTTGALTGQGSSIVGTARNFTVHPTSGALVGQGAVINGDADRQTGSVTHTTSGSLVGQGSSLSGSALNYTVHSTSGGLIGQGSLIDGNSTNFTVHATSGVLTGQGSVIDGVSEHSVAGVHETTGALIGQGSSVNGIADHISNAPELFGGGNFAYLNERSAKKQQVAKKQQELEELEKINVVNKQKVVAKIPQKVKNTIQAIVKSVDDDKQALALKLELDALKLEMRNEYLEALQTEAIRQYLILEQQRQEEEETIAMLMIAMM